MNLDVAFVAKVERMLSVLLLLSSCGGRWCLDLRIGGVYGFTATPSSPLVASFRQRSRSVSKLVLPSAADTTAAASPELLSSSPSPVTGREVVVVGGGPVGLAAALTLSNLPHWCNVTVLEGTSGLSSVSNYDPVRSFLYNINPRGLVWVDRYPAVARRLLERGSSPDGGVGQIVYVPADPDEPIPVRFDNVSISSTKGSVRVNRNYWIPRHEMVDLLQECCREQQQRIDEGEQGTCGVGSIRVLSGKRFASIEPHDEDGSLAVLCEDGTSYRGQLVVGADGIDSSVRGFLASDNDSASTTWLQSKARSFQVRRYRSPATGVRIKALQFPPNFTLTNTDGSTIMTKSEKFYVLQGLHQGTRNRLNIGFLPMKDANSVRPGNTNTRYNHEIWTECTTGPKAKAWFRKAFPRLDWDSYVNDSEWDRFAAAKGTAFPYCQYSPGSAVESPDGSTGVVLVGDACHAFPPDIGQGINAGLQDVVALDRSLQGLDIDACQSLSRDPETLGECLQNYQENRRCEHRALVRLARFGAPYQYRQPWRRDRIGRSLWTLNFILRALLNKATGGLVPAQAMMLAQDGNLTYRQVMRRADLASSVIKLIAASLFLAIGVAVASFIRTAAPWSH